MKLYNKKGLLNGAVMLTIAAAGIVIGLIKPARGFADGLKLWGWTAVVLVIGIALVVRAFSKTATEEDRIEAKDERNQLVTLTAQSKAFNIMFWLSGTAAILSTIGWAMNRANDVMLGLAAGFGLLFGLSFWVIVISVIHYEKKL